MHFLCCFSILLAKMFIFRWTCAMLRHTSLVIQKTYKNTWFSLIFDMRCSKKLIFRLTCAKNAPSHQGGYLKTYICFYVFKYFWNGDFQKSWKTLRNIKILLCDTDGIIEKHSHFSCFSILLNSWNQKTEIFVTRERAVTGGGKPRLWNPSSPVLSFKAY